MTNTKNRITVGEFKIETNSTYFSVNLAEVIEKIRPIISSTPDDVKSSIEIQFLPKEDWPCNSHRSYITHYVASITREMTVEEYTKANDAPSKASKIEMIKTCFNTAAWTGRKG